MTLGCRVNTWYLKNLLALRMKMGSFIMLKNRNVYKQPSPAWKRDPEDTEKPKQLLLMNNKTLYTSKCIKGFSEILGQLIVYQDIQKRNALDFE